MRQKRRMFTGENVHIVAFGTRARYISIEKNSARVFAPDGIRQLQDLFKGSSASGGNKLDGVVLLKTSVPEGGFKLVVYLFKKLLNLFFRLPYAGFQESSAQSP